MTPWSRSNLRLNDSTEVFHLRTEGPSWGRSILGLNESSGVVPSLERLTPVGSYDPRTEGPSWVRSILGLNDSPGVDPS